MTNANIVTVAGRPHDIRCPQSSRTDVDDCCKPMVAFTATMQERQRCYDIVNRVGLENWHPADALKLIDDSSDSSKGGK